VPLEGGVAVEGVRLQLELTGRFAGQGGAPAGGAQNPPGASPGRRAVVRATTQQLPAGRPARALTAAAGAGSAGAMREEDCEPHPRGCDRASRPRRARELPEHAEQTVQLGVLAGVAGVSWRVRRPPSIEIGDPALDRGDDLEEGGLVEFRGGRGGGGAHANLNICAVTRLRKRRVAAGPRLDQPRRRGELRRRLA
jgi:hypothetical protein